MQLQKRIYIPVALALALSSAIGITLLSQVHATIKDVESSMKSDGSMLRMPHLSKMFRRNIAMDSEHLSKALLALRQGELFVVKGEWKQAEEKFKESATLGGGSPALKKLAAIQLQRRAYDRARETISQLKREEGKTGDTILLEGLLELRSGRVPVARSIFERKAESAQGQYGLALIAIGNDDHDTAKALLKKAQENTDPSVRSSANVLLAAYNEFSLFPNGQHIHLQILLARALAQVGECESSIKLTESTLKEQEKYRDAWIVKGYCEFTTEQLKEAKVSLQRAYDLDPEKPETQYFLARTYAAMGDPQNAVTFLQYALVNGFSPTREARSLLAEYAKELGNIPLALEQLSLLTDEAKDITSFRSFVDLALSVTGKEQDSFDIAMKATKTWPKDPESHLLLARTQVALKKIDDAKISLNTALKINPKMTAALELLGKIERGIQ